MSLRHACAALLTVLAVACEPASAPSTPVATVPAPEASAAPEPSASTAGGVFRYALQEPEGIVPPEAVGPDSMAVVDALFDSLTTWDERQRPAPAAAVSWEPLTPTGSAWRFRLRPAAVFHDGAPVTADDFAFSWALAVQTGPVGEHLREVEGWQAVRDGRSKRLAGVRAIDDHTLEVRLTGSRADFPVVVGHPALGPVQRDRWEEDPVVYRESPVGNGPFEATEARARGQFVRTSRFDRWRNAQTLPRIGGVLFQIDDVDTAYLAFQQGRRDFTVLPPEAVEQARDEFPATSDDGYRGTGVLLGDVPTLYFYGFNVGRPPYDDPRIRRAVSLAIDRQQVASEILGGNLSPATSILPPALPGARTGICDACTLNLPGASQAFEERDVDQVALAFNRGGGHEDIRDIVRAALAQIDVSLVSNRRRIPPDFPTYLDRLEAGEVGVYRFGWTAAYPSLDDGLYPLFHSSQVPDAGGANYLGYTNPAVDELLDRARATLDQGARDVLYRQAERLIANDDFAVAPVVTYHHAAVAGERVRDLFYSPFGLLNLAELRLVE